MLAGAGLTKNDAEIQAAGPSGIWQLFLARKADAIASAPYYIGYVRENGGAIRIIPGDTYFPSMAQAIVVSDATIRDPPELVRKLVSATLRGMSDIMANAAAAVDDFVKAAPENKGREAVVRMIFEEYAALVYKGQATPGWIDQDRLAKLQDFYVEQGVVTSRSPLEDLYTNAFIARK